MSDSPFEGKADFNHQSFYYFLPMFNFEQKQKIGEKIAQFKGVNYSYYLIIYLNIFNLLQLISFSLKENINILINTENDINTSKFRNEILTYGNINFYRGGKIYKIKCIDSSLSNPENYNCFQLDLFWKIVKKFDESEEIITYFKKKGLNEKINLPSSIIYQLGINNSKLFNYYEFPKIEEGALLKKSISEYDIPQLIPDMPPGFSLFCTLWEATKVKQYLELNDEEKNAVIGMQKNEEDNNYITEEPIPKNKFCHLCMRKFDNYLIHIETLTHKNNITKNPFYIERAKETFERIGNFWNKKDKENINENKENSIIKTQKDDKFYQNKINSISSFSSAASTFKIDESISLIRSNSFSLEQEYIPSSRNKENFDDSNIKKPLNVKNKDIFNTPKIKSEFKYNNYFTSSTKNINNLLNKKRKITKEEKKDYFNGINTKKIKRLVRDKDVFFK